MAKFDFVFEFSSTETAKTNIYKWHTIQDFNYELSPTSLDIFCNFSCQQFFKMYG